MKNKTIGITKEKIYQKYIIENFSLIKTSLYFNISVTTCKRLLKKFNIHKSSAESLKIRKNTNKERYGVEFCLQNDSLLEKAEQTCLAKYGVKNAMQNDKIKQKQIKTVEDRYKVINVFSSAAIKEKIKLTCQQKYGVDNYAKTPEFNKKTYQAKQHNNTFNTSKPEILFKINLIKIFGINDVFSQYRDLRYPFCCDFYIKSIDTFIELNLHWTHGGHPFNKNNIKDLIKSRLWKNKHTKYYNNAVTVWTEKDPLKLMTAVKNNLKYFVFYKIKDAYKWLGNLKII